jgi:hypothetical protein
MIAMTNEPGGSQEFYCRDEAAAWFQSRGLRHITAAALKKMATKHQGPKRLRMGKFVYYTSRRIS